VCRKLNIRVNQIEIIDFIKFSIQKKFLEIKNPKEFQKKLC